jgi:hypothetical protein
VALVVLFALLTSLDVADSPAGRAPAYLAALGVAGLLGALVAFRSLRARGRFVALGNRMWPVLATLRMLIGRRGLELGALTAGIWVLEGGCPVARRS